MEDLIVLKHAKTYIDQLAKGIDPISGNMVGEDAVLQQERLKKCFAYVSQVLENVVKQEESRENPPPREGFYITSEQLAVAPISDDPVKLSKFCSGISDFVKNTSPKHLEESLVEQWLLEQGYLEETEDGQYIASEKGKEMGMETIGGLTEISKKSFTYYTSEAQHFILKHLEEIVKR